MPSNALAAVRPPGSVMRTFDSATDLTGVHLGQVGASGQCRRCLDQAGKPAKRGADCPKRWGGGLRVSEPKSDAGKCTVTLPVTDELRAHRKAQPAEPVASEIPGPGVVGRLHPVKGERPSSRATSFENGKAPGRGRRSTDGMTIGTAG